MSISPMFLFFLEEFTIVIAKLKSYMCLFENVLKQKNKNHEQYFRENCPSFFKSFSALRY